MLNLQNLKNTLSNNQIRILPPTNKGLAILLKNLFVRQRIKVFLLKRLHKMILALLISPQEIADPKSVVILHYCKILKYFTSICIPSSSPWVAIISSRTDKTLVWVYVIKDLLLLLYNLTDALHTSLIYQPKWLKIPYNDSATTRRRNVCFILKNWLILFKILLYKNQKFKVLHSLLLENGNLHGITNY